MNISMAALLLLQPHFLYQKLTWLSVHLPSELVKVAASVLAMIAAYF